MIDKSISSLINFYLQKGYIEISDIKYTFNQVLYLINKNEGTYEKEVEGNLYSSLVELINYATKEGAIEDFAYEKSNFEAKLTAIFMEKPSYYNRQLKNKGLQEYADEFLAMCSDVNYVKLEDNKRNKSFTYDGEKANLEVTINLAKPEKNPKDIERAKKAKGSSYPICPLCLENVGFYGNEVKASRSNHRTLELDILGDKWHFQYSPYMYYGKHCILLASEHTPMKIGRKTIERQLEFVDLIPEYFVGSNADIPIVGGSILGHDHYQGGAKVFPLDKSKVLISFTKNNLQVDYLDWYLQAIKLSGGKEDIILEVERINDKFKSYQNPAINIFNDDNNNAINIITRKINDNKYSTYILFRNNKTNEEYPDGIFHPDKSLHNIKKENIGLIEAMGLAILPGRLLRELDTIKDYIIGKGSNNVPEIHLDFARECKESYQGEELDSYLNTCVGQKFEQVLLACDIFRYEPCLEKKITLMEGLLYD